MLCAKQWLHVSPLFARNYIDNINEGTQSAFIIFFNVIITYVSSRIIGRLWDKESIVRFWILEDSLFVFWNITRILPFAVTSNFGISISQLLTDLRFSIPDREDTECQVHWSIDRQTHSYYKYSVISVSYFDLNNLYSCIFVRFNSPVAFLMLNEKLYFLRFSDLLLPYGNWL